MILPFVVALFVLWALIPDIPRVFGLTSLYFKMAADTRMNIFLFHYNIDQSEEYDPFLYAVLAVLLVAVQVLTLISLKKSEDLRK